MTRPARPLVLALALVVLGASCVARRRDPEPVGPTPWREWIVVSDSAERLASLGQHDAADSAIAGFVRRWPGSPEADAGAWRLLVRGAARADDSTAAATLITRVDSALARSPDAARRAQLLTMKRMAQLTHQLGTERALVRDLRAERDSARARIEEMEKLRAELAQVQAELERVRKRVTRRRPGT